MNNFKTSLLIVGLLGPLMLTSRVSLAQVTGPADAGRVEDRVRLMPPPETQRVMPSVGGKVETQAAPSGSENITFVLRDIHISGGDDIPHQKMHELYAEFLNQKISLDKVWLIASRLTTLLQSEGYFLSRVYVPQQEISDGRIKLTVVEGYISEIHLDEKAQGNHFVSEWSSRLLNRKPLQIKDIESLLLRLNDLPGQNMRAVLELPVDKNAPEGATRLSLLSVPQKMVARTIIDNYGSRYLGPVEITQQLSMSLIPSQRTDITLLSSLPTRELRYGGITQNITLGYDWGMDVSASLTGAHPGDTLKVQDIVNSSQNYGVGLTYRTIRQRDENLSFRIGYEGRDIHSKILGSFPLSTDHIRLMRVGVNYQYQDSYGGYNLSDMTVSQGLSLFGASDAGDSDLSRRQAKPGRSKLELSYSRIQSFPYSLSAIAALSGQVASGPLYASEEFGFGGQNAGRAYDSSELTGDSGVSASLEVRYQGLPPAYDVSFMPYGFYDIGKVWNKDQGQKDPISASSAGAGIRMAWDRGVNANFGLAFPLTRDISAPLNGQEQGPRYMFQISYDF